MNPRILFLIVALIMSIIVYAEDGCDYTQALDEFLLLPQPDTYSKVIGAQRALANICDPTIGFDNARRADLFSLIEQGNVYALRIGLFSYACWGGGELGDFYRSTGIFFDGNPELFMESALTQAIPRESLTRMISMPPLELTDNIDAKIQLLDDRIYKLSRLTEPTARQLSTQLIDGLRVRKKGLEETQFRETRP